MNSFSQRYGHTPVKSLIQKDNIDDDLKNALWNLIVTYYCQNKYDSINYHANSMTQAIMYHNLWAEFLKRRIDEFPTHYSKLYPVIKNFFFGEPWYRLYDLIEFMVNNYTSDDDYYEEDDEYINTEFIRHCNTVLEKELSGYRFVGRQISEINSQESIDSIELALSTIEDRIKPVRIHLKRALELFSDRKNPDYRNSIKESISAVESYCSIITGDSKATLGQAIKKVEREHGIHPALRSAFTNLYGYTSEAEGIRHALLDEESLSQEDALFMLVSCSAFINYLQQKEAKID